MESGIEHFPHGADIGVRGIGRTKEQAFERAAAALTEIVTGVAGVAPRIKTEFDCEAPSDDLLLAEWLNRLIYEMAVMRTVFGKFAVTFEHGHLHGVAWGEQIDRARHQPAVEPKGATYTALEVKQRPDGLWVAQCVVDV